MEHTLSYIAGHPRPQFVRKDWQSLDGEWDFAFDRENVGERKKFYVHGVGERKILVPFSYETEASGVGVKEQIENIWYSRCFFLTAEQMKKRVLLHFDGVDHLAKVWVNGQFAGSHEGGYTRFTLDVTELCKKGKNLLAVKAEDSFETDRPRGKQRWKERNFGCWYEQTSGIWKSVWLEFVPVVRMEGIKIQPLYEEYALRIDFDIAGFRKGCSVTFTVGRKGKTFKKVTVVPDGAREHVVIDLQADEPENQVELWHPADPKLYDLTVETECGGERDTVLSYFGYRKFCSENGVVALNHFPIYQKLLLYQGYWENSGLTPPDEESIVRDFSLIKSMGYNGIRMHQYVGDERFYYYADVMGLLVWCEMPSPHKFNEKMKAEFTAQWLDIVRQYYNYPSLCTWVIFNESWGIRGVYGDESQQRFTRAMYQLTKSCDALRPVISNDGWEHTESDVLTVHNYEQDGEKLYEMYKDFARTCAFGDAKVRQPSLYAKGFSYGGQPVFLSEYGGCAFNEDTEGGNWGYGESVNDREGFYERFEGLLKAIGKLSVFGGYCYTQFTDVQQEKNGLFTIDRKPKIDPERIKKFNDSL